MKFQTLLPACLLLLWTLTAYVSAEAPEIKVKSVSDGIVLSCGDKNEIQSTDGKTVESGKLKYKDENSGEYACVSTASSDKGPLIYVKFRSCDNCIELDVPSIVGLAVGNVVATIVIGVAVYLAVSHIPIGPNTSHKKSSDRQHLVQNEVSNRAPNDHYQPLNPKGVQKDTYDVLTNRR